MSLGCLKNYFKDSWHYGSLDSECLKQLISGRIDNKSTYVINAELITEI
jgi:hypothetical protein